MEVVNLIIRHFILQFQVGSGNFYFYLSCESQNSHDCYLPFNFYSNFEHCILISLRADSIRLKIKYQKGAPIPF